MLQRNKLMMVSMAFAVILILFGGLLLFNYENMMEKGSFLIGIIFILGAVYFLIKFLGGRNNIKTFDVNLLFIIFCLGFGLVFILLPSATETLFKGLIGMLMMLMSISKLESTLHVKKELKKHTIPFLLIGLGGIIVGLLVIVNINNVMKEWVLSTTIILFGICDVFVSHYLIVRMNNETKNG